MTASGRYSFFLFLSASCITASSSTLAQGSCNAASGALRADVLYVQTCANCAPKPLDEASDNGALGLKRGRTNRYFFRTAQTLVRNSVVVIQIKHSGVFSASERKRAHEVQLARDPIPFACRGFRVGQLDPLPRGYSGQDDDSSDAGLRLDYNDYDYQMRNGPDKSDAGKKLRRFHVSYSPDGKYLSCTSTLDADHRPHFLFQDRASIPDGRLAARAGLLAPATASPDQRFQKFEKLRLVMTNYSKNPQDSACFSFSITPKGSGLEISIADIQRKILTRNQADYRAFVEPTTWTINNINR